MNDITDSIRRHYETENNATLVSKVNQFLGTLKDGPVTASQLAGLDQFHVGGLVATAELAKFAGIQRGSYVLDAGSGLGGPSRYPADAYGCKVIGVDLAPSFVAVAELLADRTGLNDRVSYKVGNLASLPLEKGSFDIIWTQHAVMNVRDREQVYREFRRVLKPNGRLAFYDVLAGDGHTEPLFPVPWAASAETSCLLTEEETTAALQRAGLKPGPWKDVTAEAITWFSQQRPPLPQGLGLAAVIGPRFADMTANLARNIREGRVRLIMGICDALSVETGSSPGTDLPASSSL